MLVGQRWFHSVTLSCYKRGETTGVSRCWHAALLMTEVTRSRVAVPNKVALQTTWSDNSWLYSNLHRTRYKILWALWKMLFQIKLTGSVFAWTDVYMQMGRRSIFFDSSRLILWQILNPISLFIFVVHFGSSWVHVFFFFIFQPNSCIRKSCSHILQILFIIKIWEVVFNFF